MKRAMKLSVLALICIFTVTAIAGTALAAPDAGVAQVITTTASHSDVKTTQFAPHQPIFVEYVIQDGKTADIKVVDAHNNDVAGTSHTGVGGSGEFSFTLTQPGSYYVLVNGEPFYPIAVASFFVLPEVLGTVSALGVGIAAFGIVKFRNKTPKI
jgi:hypothetical protein